MALVFIGGFLIQQWDFDSLLYGVQVLMLKVVFICSDYLYNSLRKRGL